MRTTAMPFEPMLCTPVDPERLMGDWRVEMKWDGVRAIVASSGAETHIWSRRGNDITDAFADVARLIPQVVTGGSAVLDGELVVLGADSRPDFSLMQRRLGTTGRKHPPAALLLFDILRRDGGDLITWPYEERRALLESLIKPEPAILVPPVYSHDVREGVELSRANGIEGVVAKRPRSTYAPGRRTLDWVKVSNIHAVEAAAIGFLRGPDGRLASLVLGVRDPDGHLRYAGRVSSGLSDAERAALERLLGATSREQAPVPDAPERAGITWTKPSLVVEVAMSQWTPEGRMRHPRWRGVRLDKTVDDLLSP